MTELLPCVQRPFLDDSGFRSKVTLPYGVTIDEVRGAMEDVYDFLHCVNTGLVSKGLDRLEDTILGNSFSGIVSELCVLGIDKHSQVLARNKKIGGHPDLVLADKYEGDSVLKGSEGVEVKASIHSGG